MENALGKQKVESERGIWCVRKGERAKQGVGESSWSRWDLKRGLKEGERHPCGYLREAHSERKEPLQGQCSCSSVSLGWTGEWRAGLYAASQIRHLRYSHTKWPSSLLGYHPPPSSLDHLTFLTAIQHQLCVLSGSLSSPCLHALSHSLGVPAPCSALWSVLSGLLQGPPGKGVSFIHLCTCSS